MASQKLDETTQDTGHNKCCLNKKYFYTKFKKL